MCGIVSAVSKEGRIRPDAIARGTQALRHRGPDAQHLWISPDGRAGLGHARLSIIDLETGDQPIPNEDHRLQIVANGELYDFERIREQLQREGHTFRTRSDTEIALHLFEDRGPRALHTLRGEFALAIWDARDNQLFAARDRFGIKPLYYTIHDGTFYLASEIKALAALGVPLRWDRETLYDIHFVSHPPDRTLFAGIYQVPPASYLLTDGEQVRILPYWDWNYPAECNGSSTADRHDAMAEADAIAALEHQFEEEVKLRLRADVPVACYLSGGIDSCAVLGFASRLSTRPIRAYTLAFDHADYDESQLARDQAQRSGAEFCQIDIRADHLADAFADAIYHAERPFANAHCVAKYLLSRAVRDSGIKVVLTGEGSDEIFAGYPHFRRDLVLYGHLDATEKARLLAQLESANRVSAGMLMPTNGATALESVQRVLGFIPSTLEAWSQMGAGLLRVTTDEFRQRFAERDTFRVMLACLDVERQVRGRHAVHQSLYIWGKTMLPNYILSNLGDRMEMAHSVEGRLPFLDHHVVEAAARMPVSMKIKGMTEKYVLREAAREVLTPAVYARQKHPFMSPPATIQQDGRLYAFLQDTLRSATLDCPGIYDRTRVTPLLDALPSMASIEERSRADMALMWMTSLCLLAERFGLTS